MGMVEIKVKTITDNSTERLAIKWDGERFITVHLDKLADITRAIIYSPREMMDLVKFAGELGGK